LAALQRDVLDGVAERVRPGGLLVYAVCTRTRDETTDVIETFLASHPRFVVEPPEHVATDPDGMLRTAPHTHGLDGFFAARLRAARA
jgi:16S rRNA (cytosine967-C5)-methyltransferase